MKAKRAITRTAGPGRTEEACPRSTGQIFPTSKNLSLAFSLVEMLVVIAILAILMALMLPATTSILGGMNVNRAAGMVIDELNFARQAALAQNRDVEVRFYKLAAASDATNKQFRAFRSYLIDGIDPADWKPLSRLKRLPEPIILASETMYSSLFDAGNTDYGGLTKSNETLPGNGSTEYVSFLFRPDGGTSLKPVTAKWFLTLLSANHPDPSTLPANYFTVQVDPVTGRTRSYRP